MEARQRPASQAPPASLMGRARPAPETSPWALPWSAPDQSLQNRMHFRFYGSNMGMFMRPDNINGSLANPQSWNKYSYVAGNPVNMNDPTGHWYSTGPRDSGGGYAEDMFNPLFDASWVGAPGSYQVNDTLFGVSAVSHTQQSSLGATSSEASQGLFGDYSFKFDPPGLPHLSDGQQRVAAEVAWEAGLQGVNPVMAVAMAFQQSSLRNLEPSFNGRYFNYGVMQVGAAHIGETIFGVRATDTSLRLNMLNIRFGVGLLAKAVHQASSDVPGLVGEDLIRRVYGRYDHPGPNFDNRILTSKSADLFVRNNVYMGFLGY